MWRKKNIHPLLVGMQTGTAIVKTVWRFLKKLEIELPYGPVITPLDIYPKNTIALIQKNACDPMFIAASFTISKM